MECGRSPGGPITEALTKVLSFVTVIVGISVTHVSAPALVSCCYILPGHAHN